MDEYLFTVLAKLKADRLKLEREERQQAAAESLDFIETPPHRSPRARRSPASLPDFSAVVPTHGLRGWS